MSVSSSRLEEVRRTDDGFGAKGGSELLLIIEDLGAPLVGPDAKEEVKIYRAAEFTASF